MSTLSQILAEKIANKNHEGLLKHPVLFLFLFHGVFFIYDFTSLSVSREFVLIEILLT